MGKIDDFSAFASAPSQPVPTFGAIIPAEKMTPIELPADVDDEVGDGMLDFESLPELPAEFKGAQRINTPKQPAIPQDDVFSGFYTDRPTTNTANILDMDFDIPAPIQADTHETEISPRSALLDTAHLAIVCEDPEHLLENVPELGKLRE